MDLLYILAYVLLSALLLNKWGFFALTAILVSCLFAEHEFSFIITALCYTPFCLHRNNNVRLPAIVMVIFYYICGWENALSDSYYLSNFIYVLITTMLNLSLINGLLKSKRNGLLVSSDNAYSARLHDNKTDNTHNKQHQTGQN